MDLDSVKVIHKLQVYSVMSLMYTFFLFSLIILHESYLNIQLKWIY